MKRANKTILFFATLFCAALFLNAASANELSDFLGKFNPSDPYRWDGAYIGFNTGAGFNQFHFGKQMTDVNLEDQFYELEPLVFGESEVFATFHTPGKHSNDIETIGGGQTGFKFQFGNFVFGAEGGFQGNGSTGKTKYTEFQENPVFLETLQSSAIADTDFTHVRMVETTWNAWLGGNVGFAWYHFLFYGQGGVAFTDAHFEFMQIADTSFFSNFCELDCASAHPTARPVTGGPHQGEFFLGEVVDKKVHTQGDVLTGWYGGGGVGFALTNIVTVGVDYKHLDWGDQSNHLMGGNGPIFPGNSNSSMSGDQITFQVNIKIGAFGL